MITVCLYLSCANIAFFLTLTRMQVPVWAGLLDPFMIIAWSRRSCSIRELEMERVGGKERAVNSKRSSTHHRAHAQQSSHRLSIHPATQHTKRINTLTGTEIMLLC